MKGCIGKQALSEKDKRTACTAASLILELDREEKSNVLPVLREAAKDEDPVIRAAAAKSLGGCGTEAVKDLTELAKYDREDSVRRTAMQSLGQVGPGATASVPALMRAVAEESNAETQATAVEALGNIGRDAAPAIPYIEAWRLGAWQRDLFRNPQCRRVAEQAMQRIGPAPVPTLVEALKHQDRYVRRAAASLLGKAGPSASDAVPYLMLAVSEDRDGEVQEQSVEALGLIGRDAQAAAPVIARWANDNRHNRDRMRLAEQALERIGPISSEAYQVGREPTATGQPGSPPGPGRPPPAQGPQREKPPPPKKESDPISRPG